MTSAMLSTEYPNFIYYKRNVVHSYRCCAFAVAGGIRSRELYVVGSGR